METVNHPDLPKLEWVPTKAFTSRHGETPRLIAQHRWGGGTLLGVESWFENPADDASSHLVYAGEIGKYAGRCAQMVKIADKAWTESGYNPVSISIESADAIWLGKDHAGLIRLARITGFLCVHYNIEPVWPTEIQIHSGRAGIVRHADLGALGGAHPRCPTTSHTTFSTFVDVVAAEVKHGGYRDHWTR